MSCSNPSKESSPSAPSAARRRAADRLREEGFDVTEMDKRISRDEGLCFSCGACVSICPVMCFSYDPETWEVNIDNSKCIACGACVNSCARHALSLHL